MFQMAKFLQVTFDGLLLTGCLLHVFQNYADKAWWWLLDDNMRMITTMMVTTMMITTMMTTTTLPGGLRRGGGRDGSSLPAIAQRVCWGERHRGGKRLPWLLSFRNDCTPLLWNSLSTLYPGLFHLLVSSRMRSTSLARLSGGAW